MLKPKYDSYPGLTETTESVHARNQNPLKLSFSVEVWDNILTYPLDPSCVIITPWEICHPYTNACRQFVHQISIADYGVTYERVIT